MGKFRSNVDNRIFIFTDGTNSRLRTLATARCIAVRYVIAISMTCKRSVFIGFTTLFTARAGVIIGCLVLTSCFRSEIGVRLMRKFMYVFKFRNTFRFRLFTNNASEEFRAFFIFRRVLGNDTGIPLMFFLATNFLVMFTYCNVPMILIVVRPSL